MKISLLVLLAGMMAVAQTASNTRTAIERVGSKLACLCGSCNNTVSTCAMLECHYSKPAKDTITAMAAAGTSDADIIDFFVKREGLRALAEPPAEGFNLMGRVIPFVALAMGLWITFVFMQRLRRKPAAVSADVDPEALSRYQERIEKDLAKLD